MPTDPGPRLGLQAYVGSDPLNQIDEILQAAFNLLEGSGGAAVMAWGTLTARPAAGIKGRLYYAEDTQQLFYDTTSTWVQLPTTKSAFTPGDLKVSVAGAPADGWLTCDGSAVSRVTYADLFEAIGVTQGAGDGSTTFNLPDFRGRTILGAGTGGSYTDQTNGATKSLTARALGQKGGEEAHTQAPAESGVNGSGSTQNNTTDHTHGFAGYIPVISKPWQAGVGISSGGGGSGSFVFWTTGQGTIVTSDTSTQGESAPHDHQLVARRADAAANNMPPYGVANVWIKT